MLILRNTSITLVSVGDIQLSSVAAHKYLGRDFPFIIISSSSSSISISYLGTNTGGKV